MSLLISAWAGQSESQRHGEPKTAASLRGADRQRSLWHAEREGSVNRGGCRAGG